MWWYYAGASKVYQLKRSLNGVSGKFEWVDPNLGGLSHRMFYQMEQLMESHLSHDK